jgi:hypothetical protein
MCIYTASEMDNLLYTDIAIFYTVKWDEINLV